jgi:hypothetical protein
MKTRAYTSLIIVGLFITLAGATALAQYQSSIIVNIPFSFIVGNQTMPAGRYTLEPASQSGTRSLLLIRSRDGRNAAYVFTSDVQAKANQEESRLIFNHYGDDYFLHQMCVAATRYICELPTSKVEARLMASGVDPRPVALISREH